MSTKERFRTVAIVLTGCLSDSPGMHNVYILDFVEPSGLEVKVGYFGECSCDI